MACNTKVWDGRRHRTCGDWSIGQGHVFCSFHQRRYPGQICKHGLYVAGCAPHGDWLCNLCTINLTYRFGKEF
jgi:hypothetical protein